MRIAIAGTNGLAYWIARYLSTETSHQFILLSRAVSLADIFKDSADLIQPKPHLSAEGWQVITVDYGNDFDLQFKLAGVDLVISMVSGQAQIALIDAAAHVGVQRFAPAEFAGSSLDRPAMDALDRGQSAALARLRQYEAQGMRYTVLSCGILYERFAPGGTGSANIGYFSGASGEGDYLMDIRAMRAQIPHNSYGQPATICMTSAQDVGRFVVSALVLQNWPRELRMYGERIDVSEVVRVAEEMRNRVFERASHFPDTLQSQLLFAQASQDFMQQIRVNLLMATEEGRFDLGDANLNNMVQNITPIPFRQWLFAAWEGQL